MKSSFLPSWRFVSSAVVSIVLLALGGGGVSQCFAEAAVSPATQISRSTVFYQPLVCVGKEKPTEAENAILLGEIAKIRSEGLGARTQALEEFIAARTNSPWAASLRANLAYYYRQHGRYSDALKHWETVWEATRAEQGDGKKVADFTFAHWTKLLASLGRKEHLAGLFTETQGRVFDSGPLQQLINTTKEAHRIMLSDPGISFRCGTYALHSVGKLLNGPAFDSSTIDREPSPKTGFTMSRLLELAGASSLDLVPVKWGEGRKLIVPSVIHWKENHYAAIIEEKDGKYKVVDPTFGNGLWIAEKDIEREASGYFLIPRTKLDGSWQQVASAVTDKVYGTGYQNGVSDSHDGCGNNSGGGGGGGAAGGIGGALGGDGQGPGPINLGAATDSTGTAHPGGGGGQCGGSCSGGGGTNSPGGSGGGENSCPTCPSGMPVWEVSEPYITLWMYDEPLGYQPGLGNRVSFKLAYKQREGREIYSNNIFSLGPMWNCSWLSMVTWEDNELPNMVVPGGGERTYKDDGTSQERYSQTTMAPMNNHRNEGFNVYYKDGSIDAYHLVIADYFGQHAAFLTLRRDRAGNTTRFDYITNNAPQVWLKYVVDGDGRTNTLTYTNVSFPMHITGVEDPFGRKTFLKYDQFGVLTNVTDVAGLSSSFKYNALGWATNMITPYGTTTFSYTTNSDTCFTSGMDVICTNEFGMMDSGLNEYVALRTLKVVDPANGTNIYMLRQNSARIYTNSWDFYTNSSHYIPFLSSSLSGGEVPAAPTSTLENEALQYRNTFHWGPRQAVGLPADYNMFLPEHYNKARLRHWLHRSEDNGAMILVLGQTISQQREPSPDGITEGQRTWYDYDGKAAVAGEGTSRLPASISRILPDGTTWYQWFRRDEWGHPTNVVETWSTWFGETPATRTNIYIYSGFDLVKHIGPTDIVEDSYVYDGNHQLIRYTNAVNDVTYFLYDGNSRHIRTISAGGLTTTNVYYDSGEGMNFVQKTIDIEINRTNFYTYTNNLVLNHIDERGLSTTNTWDALQRLRRVDYPDNTSITNSYDKLDLTWAKDRMGFTNALGYDAVRRLIAATNALGYYTLYNYCSCGALDSIQDKEGRFTYFFYNNVGWLFNRVDADGYAITNTYTLLGQPAIFTDNAGRCYTNWHNNQGLWVGRSSEFGTEQSILHDIENRPEFVTDANSVTITNTYDDLGRLRTRGYPDGGIEKFGYSSRGLIAYTNQMGFTNFYVYDAASRKMFETNANFELIRYTNNAAGDLLALVDGKTQVTKWNYDEFGRVTNKLDQAGTVLLRYTYDADWRLASRWSAEKGTTYYTNDAVGNLTKINYPASPDVTFGYDAMNRMTNMVDTAGTTKYVYTAAGRLFTEDGPFVSDTLTNIYFNGLRTNLSLQQPVGAWTNRFMYDSAKRLTNVISPAGSFAYLLGGTSDTSPLIRRIALPNTSYITNTYDGDARLTGTWLKNSGNSTLDSATYAYNLINQRINFTNAAGTYVTNTYDRIGQLRDANSSVNAEDRGYTYDAAWNLSSRTINGTPQTFTVDNKNQLTGAANLAPSYDANGNLWYAEDDAYDQYTYYYDDENRLEQWDWYNSDAMEWMGRVQFVYDGLGRLRLRIEWGRDESDFLIVGKYQYIYDGMRVIQERSVPALDEPDIGTPSVSYTRGTDLSGSLEGAGGIGGLLARTDFTPCNTTLHINITNHSGYCLYDLQISDNTGAYVSGASIADGDTGNYSFTGVPGRNYSIGALSCDSIFIQVLSHVFTAALDTYNIDFVDIGGGGAAQPYESGLPLCDAGQSGYLLTHNYYHADGNGNITYLESSSQALAASYRYDSFGNTISQSGSLATANVYRFSSKEIHATSGLYYYGYRWYAPNLQRWLNRDPLRELGFEKLRNREFISKNPKKIAPKIIESSNLYVFIDNDPINKMDPLGLVTVYSCAGMLSGCTFCYVCVGINNPAETFSGCDSLSALNCLGMAIVARGCGPVFFPWATPW